MREVKGHLNGDPMNDRVELRSDELGNGGAAHRYIGRVNGEVVLTVQFQDGARDEEGSTAGATDASLLAIVLDRLASFSAGPYPSRETALARTKVEEALHWLRARADERRSRGVLGRNEK